MTDVEKREAARQFVIKWNGKGKEDEDDRSYWLDILQRIMGANDATDRIEFQKKVIVDGNTTILIFVHPKNVPFVIVVRVGGRSTTGPNDVHPLKQYC